MAATAENASIISNGSFESYRTPNNDVFPDSQTYAGMNSTRYAYNWSYGTGAGLCASGDTPFLGGGDVPDGSIAVYLQSSGWISQSVVVAEPGVYEVSFRYASRPKYLNGQLSATVVDAAGGETVIDSVDCPTTKFRTAYMKVYLAAGSYTLKIVHAKGGATGTGDSIVDAVQMKRMDNLISNPSFEDYVSSATLTTYKPFDTSTYPEVWEWGGNCTFDSNRSFGGVGVVDGEITIAMRAKAKLSQTFIAPTTGVYEVTFRYGNRNASGNGSIKAYALIDGNGLGYAPMWTNAVLTAYFYTNFVAWQSYTLSITNNTTSSVTGNDFTIDLVSVAFSTNVIKNGGFEAGYVSGQYNSSANGRYNPHWTTTSGTVGLEKWTGTQWHGSVDVGTYCLYMQTSSGSSDSAVTQTFTVTDPGIYALSFHHVKRNSDRSDPVTRVRVYAGRGTRGTVIHEWSVTSSLAAKDGVWGEFSASVKLADAGEYTLEFLREGGTRQDISAILDDVCLAWQRKIRKGFTLIVR